ncbi:MAG: D-aminoacyl-tRNA deacylase [Clostridia bacterium]|nr:D-aminoacyl-tRNA deacylase [Clostridia bacterium]
MKMVIQRVNSASVDIDGKTVGKIGKGYLMLLGVGEGDTGEIAEKMVDKLFRLRIFEDENGKTNLSAESVGAEILVVSQFTLYASCRKGNRPSFTDAAPPDLANRLYEKVIELCGSRFSKTEHGEFGADMKVSLVNDGPFTVVLDSGELNIV